MWDINGPVKIIYVGDLVSCPKLSKSFSVSPMWLSDITSIVHLIIHCKSYFELFLIYFQFYVRFNFTVIAYIMNTRVSLFMDMSSVGTKKTHNKLMSWATRFYKDGLARYTRIGHFSKFVFTITGSKYFFLFLLKSWANFFEHINFNFQTKHTLKT